MFFSKAIVKRPCKNIISGITTSNLGIPDYNKAIIQHDNYISALQDCGLEIIILEADEDYPDSTFIEDIALLTPHCAIITNPALTSRKGEISEIGDVLGRFYSNIHYIKDPGTVEAGDILMVENHFYIGLSQRTNLVGAKQVLQILNSNGISGSVINIENVLHLKSGTAYLGNNDLIANREFIKKSEFQKFNILEIPEDESYAANCLLINDRVLIPAGYTRTKKLIENAGYTTLAIDVSEFRKLDGGLSCLSLRF